jgi:hypothetical protein
MVTLKFFVFRVSARTDLLKSKRAAIGKKAIQNKFFLKLIICLYPSKGRPPGGLPAMSNSTSIMVGAPGSTFSVDIGLWDIL